MPSDPNAKWRVRIAFVLLFVVFVVGAYFAAGLSKLQQSIATRESQTAVQGVTDAGQIDDALKQHPQNKFLLLIAMATKAADATSAAIESLSNEIAPPSVSRNIDYAAASQSDLEALRRDLKTAQANATSFLPRYAALLKAERDNVEKYAVSHVDKGTADRLLQSIDSRQADITAFTSRMLSARADLYRAYDDYVAFMAAQADRYKIEKGQFIFPLQSTLKRYNVMADAVTVAANRVAELDKEGKSLWASQQERWTQAVNGK